MPYKNWRFCCGKFFLAEGKHKKFIAKICNGPDEDGDYEVNFMKQSEKIKHGFQFPEKVDIASVQLNDIVKLLPKPTSVATTKRLRGVFKFACDLSFYAFLLCLNIGDSFSHTFKTLYYIKRHSGLPNAYFKLYVACLF